MYTDAWRASIVSAWIKHGAASEGPAAALLDEPPRRPLEARACPGRVYNYMYVYIYIYIYIYIYAYTYIYIYT